LKLLKVILTVFLVLVGLLVLGLGILFWTVDPNDYKPQMEKLVLEKTGLSLELPSKISWSIWPILGVKTSELKLENEQNVFKFENVELGIVPWAFLRGDFSSDINVKGSSFFYNEFLIQNIHLDVQHFQFGAPFSLNLSGRLEKGLAAPIDFDLKSQITLSLKENDQRGEDFLKLKEIRASFNQSDLEGEVEVHDFSKPLLTANLTSESFNVSDWVNTKAVSLRLYKVGMVTHLTLDGTDASVVPSSLNGEAKITVQNSVLTGIDVGRVLVGIRKTLASLLDSSAGGNSLSLLGNLPTVLSASSDKAISLSPEGETRFGEFASEAVITNGVVHHNQIALSSDHFRVEGSGELDLNRQQLAYQFNVYGSDHDNPDEYVIPFVMNGQLNDPDMGIDYSALMGQLHKIIEAQMKNVLIQALSSGTVGAVQGAQGLVGNLLGQQGQ
jgi:hypothetical protein